MLKKILNIEMKIKTLLLASTTLVCVTLPGNSSELAKTNRIPANNRLGDAIVADSKTHSGDTHNHASIMEIPAGQPVPSVDLIVHKDPMRGWNLETKVTNFRFAPENVSKEAKSGEGHAHIYVNGEKINRLYSSWYHIENLKPGKNTISVGLNANSHEVLVHNGQKIEDTEIIEVPASTNQTN